MIECEVVRKRTIITDDRGEELIGSVFLISVIEFGYKIRTFSRETAEMAYMCIPDNCVIYGRIKGKMTSFVNDKTMLSSIDIEV